MMKQSLLLFSFFLPPCSPPSFLPFFPTFLCFPLTVSPSLFPLPSSSFLSLSFFLFLFSPQGLHQPEGKLSRENQESKQEPR